jgi:hypothetical protein
MSVSVATRIIIRERADFACEYCGVSETDTGAELTIDHYHPQSLGGTDDLENLLYSCSRCNQYKADYWPVDQNAQLLWNPRSEPIDTQFLPLPDGSLHPLTASADFTLRRLRLNRAPLVAHRLRRQQEAETRRLLETQRSLIETQEQVQKHQERLLEEQQGLLEEQRIIIRQLLPEHFR